MSFLSDGIDILLFVDLLPESLRPPFYKLFWKWRFRVNKKLAGKKIIGGANDTDYSAWMFTAKEALEAAVTDCWRAHAAETYKQAGDKFDSSWEGRFEKRLGSQLKTLHLCIDKLLSHPSMLKKDPGLLGSTEQNVVYDMVCLLSGERGSPENRHLRWADPNMVIEYIAVNSRLRAPFVQWMVFGPPITYTSLEIFNGLFKQAQFSTSRETIIVLLESLMNDCMRWWKITYEERSAGIPEEERAKIPEIEISDSEYLLTSKNSAEELLKQSQVLFNLRRYIRAFRVIDQAVQLDPVNISLWEHRSLVAGRIESPEFDDVAEQSIELAAQNVGDNAEAIYELGNHFLHSQPPDYEKAITFYSKAIELDPHASDAICNRGVAYLNLDQNEDALADFDRVIEVNPADKFAYINKARVYYYEQRYDESFEQIERTLSLDPSYEFAVYFKALIYLQRDNNDLCLQNCDLAIQINPKYRDALYLRNRLRSDLHREDCTAKSSGNEWIADIADRCRRCSGGFEEFNKVLEGAKKIEALKGQAESYLSDLNSRGEQGDDWWDEVSKCFHEWMDIKIKLLKHQPLFQEERKGHILPLPSFKSDIESAGPRDAKSISEGYLNRLEVISYVFWKDVKFKDTFSSPPDELRTEIKDYGRWHVSWFHPLGYGRSRDIHDLLSESSHYYLEADGKLFCCDHFKWFDLNYLEDNVDLCSLIIKEVLGDFDDRKARQSILEKTSTFENI